MRLISQVTDRLVQTLDFDEALRILIEGATELLDVARASIMILDRETNELTIKVGKGLSDDVITDTRIPVGQGIAGMVAATGEPVVVQDVRRLEQWQATSEEQATEYRDFSALSVPLVLHGEVRGVMNFNHKLDGSPLGDQDLELALLIANQASVALYLAMLHRQYLKKQALDYELKVARDVQRRMHPTQPPRLDGFRFAADSLMCHEVGGDYYDYVQLADGRLGIAIGDVAGHGLGPALLVTDARAAIRGGWRRGDSLEKFLADLNEELRQETNPEHYMTMLVAELDPVHRRLELATAGHHMPIVLRDGRPLDLPKAGANIPLGIQPAYEYAREKPIDLQPGDLLLFFTDGLWEATDAAGHRFGNEGITRHLRRLAQEPPATIVRGLLQAVRTHAGYDLTDDCTLIIVQVS